jgi:hypothetical protein
MNCTRKQTVLTRFGLKSAFGSCFWSCGNVNCSEQVIAASKAPFDQAEDALQQPHQGNTISCKIAETFAELTRMKGCWQCNARLQIQELQTVCPQLHDNTISGTVTG